MKVDEGLWPLSFLIHEVRLTMLICFLTGGQGTLNPRDPPDQFCYDFALTYSGGSLMVIHFRRTVGFQLVGAFSRT